MDKLSSAQEHLTKLTDVRIVYLPPATVAAVHVIGEEPEYQAGALIDAFVREAGLCAIKPDLRHYGFNHPIPVDETGRHGYEMGVTIPDGGVAPLAKKRFAGGLCTRPMCSMGISTNSNGFDWVNKSDKYVYRRYAELGHMWAARRTSQLH